MARAVAIWFHQVHGVAAGLRSSPFIPPSAPPDATTAPPIEGLRATVATSADNEATVRLEARQHLPLPAARPSAHFHLPWLGGGHHIIRHAGQPCGRVMWKRKEQVFAAVIDGSLEADQACVLLRHMAKTTPWAGGPLNAVARPATGSNDSDMLRLLERGQADIMGMGCDDQVKAMLHLRTWLGMLDARDRAPVSVGREGVDGLSHVRALIALGHGQ